MPGSINLPDDSQVALSASVKDDAGFVDESATLNWSSSDSTLVSLSDTTGTDVTATAQSGPGSVATVTLSVTDASGNPVNAQDGSPLTDTLDITIAASADTTIGITPGAITHK